MAGITTQTASLATIPTATPIAADQVGTATAPATGDRIQYVKLDAGAAGASAPVSSAAPLPVGDAGGSLTVDGTVAVSTLPALVAGTANIGDVDVLTLPQLTAMAAATSTPTGVVSLGNSLGKTVIGKPGSLASSATTANQAITGATWTVAVGKTGYIAHVDVSARLTTFATTATLFGTASLRIGGTAIATWELAAGGAAYPQAFEPAEPLPVAAGVVVDLVVTPSAATAFTWKGNILGYEK